MVSNKKCIVFIIMLLQKINKLMNKQNEDENNFWIIFLQYCQSFKKTIFSNFCVHCNGT